MKPRIFIGCYEIASVLKGLAEGFTANNCKVTTAVIGKNKFYKTYNYDYEIDAPLLKHLRYDSRKLPGLLKSLFIRVDRLITAARLKLLEPRWINEHDIFVFIWNAWDEEERIFKKLKAEGKTIVCYHLGSEVRHIPAFLQEFPVTESKSFLSALTYDKLNEKLQKVRIHEKYADFIFSVPDQAGLNIRPYYHAYMPVPGIDAIPFQSVLGSPIRILHAPSFASKKGTEHILNVIDSLWGEGMQFEFKVLTGVPHEVIIRELLHTDIVIDELIGHGPGVLAAESMAAGCVVMTNFLEKYKDVFPAPVIPVSEKTLLTTLRNTLNDRELLMSLKSRARQFAIAKNTPSEVAAKMLNIIKSSLLEEYVPRFFLERFKKPKEAQLSEKNKQLNEEILDKYGKELDLTILNRLREEQLIS